MHELLRNTLVIGCVFFSAVALGFYCLFRIVLDETKARKEARRKRRFKHQHMIDFND